MVGGQGATNFGGVDVVPLLGVIAGCHCSVLWWRVTANFWGVDVVPLQGAIVEGVATNFGGADVVPSPGAIAGCYCSVLWWNLGEWKWCHCRVPIAPYTAMASRKNILQTSLFSTLMTQKLFFAIWRLCWYNLVFRFFLLKWGNIGQSLFISFDSLTILYHFHTEQLPLWRRGFRNSRFPLITHDAAQLDLPWHIWGWNHDAAPDYAGVQLVTRQLCLEHDLQMDNAPYVDKDPLARFDESTQLIDWLVLGATHCEAMFSNNCLKVNWT